jgi:hypothetical protein
MMVAAWVVEKANREAMLMRARLFFSFIVFSFIVFRGRI